MADNKRLVDKRDRNRIASGEPYEIRDLARKMGVSTSQAAKAAREAGPMRSNVERKLHETRGGRHK
jgi:hypothetical protein